MTNGAMDMRSLHGLSAHGRAPEANDQDEEQRHDGASAQSLPQGRLFPTERRQGTYLQGRQVKFNHESIS